MSDKEAELISRNTYRRMVRKFKKDMLLTVKILSLWLLCAFVVFLVAVAFIDYPYTLFWNVVEEICLVVTAVVMVKATMYEIEQLKKSHRCGNTRTGHMQK